MGNAGRNGGEYYTPRPLIRAMQQVIQPKIGERIYAGAVGSAGFLCESFDYLKSKGKLTTKRTGRASICRCRRALRVRTPVRRKTWAARTAMRCSSKFSATPSTNSTRT